MTDFGRVATERKYGCALLAGGEGRRLGGVNKSLLPAGGGADRADSETLLARTGRILSGTGMPCYLSVAVYDVPVTDGWTAVDDRDWLEGCLPDGAPSWGTAAAAISGFVGPLGGIYACLSKAQEDGLSGLFFVPCDAPQYEVDVIGKMLPYLLEEGNPDAEVLQTPDAIIWQTRDGRQQVAFGWYSISCLPVLRKQLAAGHYKVRDALAELRVMQLQTEAEGLPEERFRNLNTPEDLDH